MYTKTKRRLVRILSLTFMATLVLLGSSLLPNVYSAKATVAAPQNLKVDALGYLRWDEVSGATGYEWSYSTDGSSYSLGGTCEGAEADVSAAISKAVLAKADGATSATLYLKVKATNGEESQLTHTFDKYINYGYSQHDLADVYAPANDGITGNFQVRSGLYMNELMTFGVSISSFLNTSGGKTDFFVGLLSHNTDATVSGNLNYFYKLRFEAHGWTKILTGTGSVKFNQDIATVDMVANQPSYFAVGVFDTYNVSDGSVAGETVYLRRTDIVEGKPVVVYASGITTGKIGNNPNQTFFTTEEAIDRPSHLSNARNHTTVSDRTEKVTLDDGTEVRTGTRPKDTFALYSGTDSAIKTTSGKIPAASGISVPSMTYYDSVTNQVRWNRVQGATAYEWSYAGKNTWTQTTEEYIPASEVTAAIQSAKASGAGNVRFAVRAVNESGKSQTAYVGLDLTAFYSKLTAIKDISDIHANLQDPSATLAGSDIYSNSGYAINTFVENAFTFNNLTNWQRRFAASMLASGDGQWNGYDVTIHAQGYITISTGLQWQVGHADYINCFWQNSQAVKFEAGQKYIATYGVEELFDENGEKVADRISVRISEVEADGYRKLLTIVSYDNYEYDWEGVKRPTLNASGTYTNKQINYHITSVESSTEYCKVSCASLVRDINYVVADGVTHENPATYTVGDTVTFADPTVSTGYAFEGWYLDKDYNEEITDTTGLYNNLTVYAKLREWNSVTVLDKTENEVKTEKAENDEYVLPSYSENGVIGYDVEGKLYKAGDTIPVLGNITIKEVWLNIVMENGAYIRLSDNEGYYGGLRFKVTADSETITKYADKIKIFGMVVPTEQISGDFDGVDENPAIKELTEYSTKDGLNVYYITLTNVLYTNYNRAFSARGYAEIAYENGADKVYTLYSKDNNSRSVYELACMVANVVAEEESAILAEYLSYTVNLVKDGNTYSVATTQDNFPTGFERKYTFVDGVLTLFDIPERLVEVLKTRPYVPVTVYDGDTCERILVNVELNGTTATANLVIE